MTRHLRKSIYKEKLFLFLFVLVSVLDFCVAGPVVRQNFKVAGSCHRGNSSHSDQETERKNGSGSGEEERREGKGQEEDDKDEKYRSDRRGHGEDMSQETGRHYHKNRQPCVC